MKTQEPEELCCECGRPAKTKVVDSGGHVLFDVETEDVLDAVTYGVSYFEDGEYYCGKDGFCENE
jgi:hypothetical protein